MFLQLICIALIFTIIYWYLVKPKNLPPGPNGVPFLGYLPWLVYYSKDMYKLLDNLKKYGNVVCIRVGFNYMIYLNDMKTIKEAYVTQAESFSSRGLKLIHSEITHGKGILTSDGRYQKENRKFIVKSLRNMGFGKVSFEDHIFETIENMCEEIDAHIEKHPNKSFDFHKCLTESVADNITRIVFGFKFNKAQLALLIKQLEMLQHIPMAVFLFNSFPFLLPLMKLNIFKKMIGLTSYKQTATPILDMVSKFINEHRSAFDRNNISDFLYSYIDEQAKHQKTKEDAYWWDDEQIQWACSEIIIVGLETTVSTIAWSLFLIANDQEWLERVTNEIDSVIGRERKPSTRDLPSLPLCEASILETLRWSCLLPIGLPHSNVKDSKLLGYFIPKNSVMLANPHCVSRDKTVWADPDNFNPAENYLSRDQNEIINKDKFIPFGVGPRNCMGESLARMEINLFFIRILQKYHLSLDSVAGMSSMKFDGVLRIPGHKILHFQLRK